MDRDLFDKDVSLDLQVNSLVFNCYNRSNLLGVNASADSLSRDNN